MKFGAWVVATLILGAVGAHLLFADPGYVVINIRGWLIEMSVPILLAGILAIMLALWLAWELLQAPRKLGEKAGELRARRAGHQFTRGLIQVAEGNFSRGEKLLTRGVNRADAPLLNYLAAARAAQLQGDAERRDKWLRLAYEETPDAAHAVLLTQAELQLAAEEYEQALATLRRLMEDAPNHSQALFLLGRLYRELEDWEQLGELLPKLKKQGRIPAETLQEWTREVHRRKLEQAGGDPTGVTAVWKQIPRALRDDDVLIGAYVDALARAGGEEVAEAELRRRLRSRWSPTLARLYGRLETADAGRQLRHAENWLKQHGEDAGLLQAAGRLCMRQELWGKARSYLETALAIGPTPETYELYGRLLTRLGEGEAATDAYRSGLAMIDTSDRLALPHLEDSGDATR
ncbi:MAG TPA: heme biosynthesis HemY N-terminal domain-containing protein [Woeseiaceae bacterium]|nr:heme biosynthesis HemY N-terminal domain-containing protein [Woeseiaceae bacterium]